jgi:hypothetical protein
MQGLRFYPRPKQAAGIWSRIGPEFSRVPLPGAKILRFGRCLLGLSPLGAAIIDLHG